MRAVPSFQEEAGCVLGMGDLARLGSHASSRAARHPHRARASARSTGEEPDAVWMGVTRELREMDCAGVMGGTTCHAWWRGAERSHSWAATAACTGEEDRPAVWRGATSSLELGRTGCARGTLTSPRRRESGQADKDIV